MNVPQFCVPFDYDGMRILSALSYSRWLQYKFEYVKHLEVYDLLSRQICFQKEFSKKVQSVSFARLYNNFIVYVEGGKCVKVA